MKPLIALVPMFYLNLAIACSGGDSREFGGFSLIGGEQKFGESTLTEPGKVTIDTSFVGDLVNDPTGENLAKNREELFYLISRGSKEALIAGIKVFLHLLKNPKYVQECGVHEMFNKEEIAYVISRSWIFHDVLCDLENTEKQTLLNYYEQHPELYGLIFDPPWAKGNLLCN